MPSNIYMTPSRQEKKTFLTEAGLCLGSPFETMPVRVPRGLSWFPMRAQNVSAPNIYRGSIAEPAFDGSAP